MRFPASVSTVVPNDQFDRTRSDRPGAGRGCAHALGDVGTRRARRRSGSLVRPPLDPSRSRRDRRSLRRGSGHRGVVDAGCRSASSRGLLRVRARPPAGEPDQPARGARANLGEPSRRAAPSGLSATLRAARRRRPAAGAALRRTPLSRMARRGPPLRHPRLHGRCAPGAHGCVATSSGDPPRAPGGHRAPSRRGEGRGRERPRLYPRGDAWFTGRRAR